MHCLRRLVFAALLGFAPTMQANAADGTAAEFRTDFLAGNLTWEQILEQARREGRVNLFLWGGNDVLSLWIDSVARPQMAALGIDLHPSRLTATRDAVNLVIEESAAGKTIGEGSADIIWLNGQNHLALAERDLLFGSFAEKLPHATNFDWNPKDPRSHPNLFDFEVETREREIPWSSEQYVCAVDRQRVAKADTPETFADLKSYLQANPGRFSYIAPPEKSGTTFVVAALFAHNPDGNGATPFQRGATNLGATELARLMAPGLAYLRSLKPHLLRDDSGDVRYLVNALEADGLFRDGAVHFVCAFGTYKTASRITTGRYPATTEAMIFPKGLMIKTKTFLAIPVNASHPAAALVLANHLASVDAQASMLGVVGYAPGIDLWMLQENDAKTIEAAAPPHVGVTQKELDANAVADAHASLIDIIATAWRVHVLEGKTDGLEETIRNAMAEAASRPDR